MWWQKTFAWLFIAQFYTLKALPQSRNPNGVTRVAGGTLIDCREPHGSYFPDPEDCRHFYHCSDWSGLQKKSCGSHLYFNAQTGVCDWPSVVRRARPECPDPNALEEHVNPRAHQSILPGKAGQLSSVQFPKTTGSEPTTLSTTPPTEVPRRSRPSVGVPARFPDQQPVVLFDPSEFIQRTKPAPQSVPRFQPQIDSITAPGFQAPSSTVSLNRFQPQPIFNPGSPFQQFPGFGQIPQSSTPQRAIPPVPRQQPAQTGQFAFQPTGTIEAVRDLPVNAVPARSRQPIRTNTDIPSGTL